MRASRVIGLLAIALLLAGCGAVANATLTAGGGAGSSAAHPPDVAVVSGSMGGAQPLTPLARRTAGSVTLRTFTTPASSGVGCAANGACIPDWCEPTQTVVTELSTPAMAAVLDSTVIGVGPGSLLSVLGTYGGGSAGEGIVSSAVPGGSAAYSSNLQMDVPAGPDGGEPAVVGTAEGDPVQVVAVRAAPSVTKVTMRTAKGDDSSAPVGGLAVLAVEGNPSSGELTATDAQGRTVATASLPAAPTAATAACAPRPPSLPPPGVQPADVAAATAAVRQAYTTAFTAVPGRDPDAAPPTVQDGDQILGTIKQARRNFPQAAATITVKTGQVVFTSPTTASLFFTVTYQQGAPYGTQIGTAVLEDGRWLVTKDTFCALLAFGGATCPAG